MTTESQIEALAEGQLHELARLKKDWWWLTVLGCTLVLCGIVAISFPFFSSIGMAIVIGTVLLVSGVATVIGAFWAGKWSAFLLQLLVGILYMVLGLAITDAPGLTVMALTSLVAAFCIVAGVFRITAALVLKFPQWGWALLNGVITTLLGVIIFRHFPETGLWLIGTLVGIELVFNGATWIMLSLNIRSLPEVENVTSNQGEPSPE